MPRFTRTIVNENEEEVEITVSVNERSVLIVLAHPGNEEDRDVLECSSNEAKVIRELLELAKPAYKKD
jgi:hypothetical protein